MFMSSRCLSHTDYCIDSLISVTYYSGLNPGDVDTAFRDLEDQEERLTKLINGGKAVPQQLIQEIHMTVEPVLIQRMTHVQRIGFHDKRRKLLRLLNGHLYNTSVPDAVDGEEMSLIPEDEDDSM